MAGRPGAARAGPGGRRRGGARCEPAAADRRPRDARRPPRRPADPRQLPGRQPHRLHDGPDAVGARTAWSACSGSTTGSSRGSARSTATTCWPARRSPASATSAPRTASCCSTRSAPPPRRLVVTYTGADAAQRPGPAARRTPRRAARRPRPHHRGAGARRQVVVKHPLQGFDLRNVEPGRLGTPDAVHLRPADAGGRDRRARAAAGPAAVPRPSRWPSRSRGPLPTTIALADLVSFFRDPVKGFFRALDLTLPWDVDGVSDAMPVEIDQLETWGVGDRMLADMLRGIHPDTAREIEWRRGALPPGQLGWRKATEVRETAMNLAVAALTHRQVAPQALRRRHRPARRPSAHRHDHAGLRRPAGRGRLLPARRQAPARVVGPAAGARGRPPRPQLDGADHRPRPARHARPPSGCSARPSTSRSTLLTDLVDLYDEGRRAPLQLPLKTSFAWASAAHIGQEPRPEALQEVEEPAGSPARTPTRPTSGSGASTPTSPTCTAARRLAERLWFPLLRSERGPL